MKKGLRLLTKYGIVNHTDLQLCGIRRQKYWKGSEQGRRRCSVWQSFAERPGQILCPPQITYSWNRAASRAALRRQRR